MFFHFQWSLLQFKVSCHTITGNSIFLWAAIMYATHSILFSKCIYWLTYFKNNINKFFKLEQNLSVAPNTVIYL